MMRYCLVLLCAAAAAQTDVSGTWSGMGGEPISLVLKQNGTVISGSAGPTTKDQLLQLESGAIDGDHVVIKAGPLHLDIHVQGDEMRGEAVFGNRTSKVYLKRAAKLNPDARFEVASVKRAPPPPDRNFSSSMRVDPGRLFCRNVSLRKLIVNSYEVKDYQVNGPEWMDSELYDIDAAVPPGTSGDQLLVMLQNLLADRFRLTLHREMRQMSVYALVVAKSGAKLHAGSGMGGTTASPGKIRGDSVPIRNLVQALSRQMDLPVVDMTDLRGTYNFTLEWTPDTRPDAGGRGAATADVTPGSSIFTAIQDQLGLKLEPRKEPQEILVVDRLEKTPTEN